MEEQKKCTKCCKTKPLSEFYTKGRCEEKVRYTSRCKKCVSLVKKREYKLKKKAKINSNLSIRVSFTRSLTCKELSKIYSKVLEI